MSISRWETQCQLRSVDKDESHGVGEAGALLPPGHHHDWIPTENETARLADLDSVLHAVIDVLDPNLVRRNCKLFIV